MLTFVAGVATGALGTYLAHRALDKARKEDIRDEAAEKFERVRSQMPALITEMKEDLLRPKDQLTREFFILPHERVAMGRSSKPRFAYFESKHENLRGMVTVLENEGFVADVTPGNPDSP